MIIACSGPPRSPTDRNRDLALVIVAGRSPKQLVIDLASESADAVLMTDPEDLGDPADFEGVCAILGLASVWVKPPGHGMLRLFASGRYVRDVVETVRAISGLKAGTTTIRRAWLAAWAHRVAVECPGDSASRVGRELVRRVFLQALHARSVDELSKATGTTPRRLRAAIARLGLRGPRRFLAVARIFNAWEHIRARAETLEQTALRLHWSSLSALDRASRSVTGLAPKELGLLGPEGLAELCLSGSQPWFGGRKC